MRISVILLFMLVRFESVADAVCDDLWFSRNLVFDRAGYCFDSALGQAVFDNSDCSTKDPALSANEKEFVRTVREEERFAGCKTDTSRTSLRIDLMELRLKITHPVARAPEESACIHWLGDGIDLYAAPDQYSPVIGRIRAADDIFWSYFWMETQPGWDFMMGMRDGKPVSMGFTRQTIDPEWCISMAG
jgi:hypothetical protein